MEEDNDFNDDGEGITLQGFRRSRNSTNWLYRGTAMTRTDGMGIDELRLHQADIQDVLTSTLAAFATVAAAACSKL